MSLHWAWAWALAGLTVVPALLAYAWWVRRRRRRAAIRVASAALVRAALPTRRRWVRRLPAALLVLGLVALAIGAARPQARVPVADNSTTILLALDVSGSMCSTDVSPNRLAAAEKAAAGFIRSRPGGAKIGLVTFAGVAGVLVPPTDDKGDLLDALDKLTTARGTAIGEAILTSIDAIADVDSSVAPTGAKAGRDGRGVGRRGDVPFAADAIVVLTDGANTEGVEPRTAAQQAAQRGLRVYTIGFGTTDPAPMVCTSSQIGDRYGGYGGYGAYGAYGGYGGGLAGNPMVMNADQLRQVAEITKAKYYRAKNADQLDEALGNLPASITVTHKVHDLGAWSAALGGLLAVTGIGLSLWFQRVRRVGG